MKTPLWRDKDERRKDISPYRGRARRSGGTLDDPPILEPPLEVWLAFLRDRFPELYVSTVIYFDTYVEESDELYGTRVPE